jgi:crossover junction endodeoxyribonuclease RusA
MQNALTLDLPWPNSMNTHWRHARGYTYISKKGVEFRKKVGEYVAERQLVGPEGFVTMHIQLWPDSKRKLDIDNRIKPVLDALECAGVILDDCLVYKLIVERMPVVKGGKCVVIISEWSKNES